MKKRTSEPSFRKALLALGLCAPLAFLFGCDSSGPASGTLICAVNAKACPDNYYCEHISNTCWKSGSGPDSGALDAVTSPVDSSGAADGPVADVHDVALDAADGAASPILDAATDQPAGTGGTDGADSDGNLSDTSADTQLRSDVSDFRDGASNTAIDQAPACNGGCCSDTDCPLTSPVCGAANQCTKCTADSACTGRSATACNTTTGACVQCTKNSQCAGATATCNLTTSTCTGCTQRSDCPGACQACDNGACVPVKSAADPTGCAGTCDGNGECKGTQGQKCTAVAGGCISGTTCSPDGICCDRACTGSCEACDLSTKLGTCAALLASSQPHTGHAACAGTGTCAGTCAGNTDGTCTFPTSACGTASCTGTTSQAAGICSLGTCSLPAATTCKTGATCSGNACACPTGATDCGTACADLSSDAKNCGICGHDCLGGTCSSGICQPVMLATVTESRPSGYLYADGGKVYAVTVEWAALDTSRLWVLDATTPGTATKVLPELSSYVRCVMNGTALWDNGTDTNGNQVFSYCTPSNCSATTKSFAIPGTGASGATLGVWPTCDLANSEVVWAMQATSGTDTTLSVWRSSITGSNIRTVTSFPLNDGADSSTSPEFAAGRSDRIFFTRTTGTAIQLLFVPTGTQNAAPAVIASGNTGGPLDFGFNPFYADDSLLVWSTNTGTYKVSLPSGIGSSSPATFTQSLIASGIMDNKHFYGMLSLLSSMAWCPVSNCGSPAVLTSSIPFDLDHPGSHARQCGDLLDRVVHRREQLHGVEGGQAAFLIGPEPTA